MVNFACSWNKCRNIKFFCFFLKTKVDSGVGTQNNEVCVKSSDFEVFEALAMDSVSVGAAKSNDSQPGQYY